MFLRGCYQHWEVCRGKRGGHRLLERSQLEQEEERAPTLHHGCSAGFCMRTWLDLVLTWASGTA